MSFTGPSLRAIAKFWANTDAFHFSLPVTDADFCITQTAVEYAFFSSECKCRLRKQTE